MARDLTLPPFTLDTREWLVATPAQSGINDDFGGRPLVASLSTALVRDGALYCGRAAIAVGLADDITSSAGPGALTDDDCAALLADVAEEISVRAQDGVVHRQYVLPAPNSSLALLADFESDVTTEVAVQRELIQRFDALIRSFRWA